MALLLNKLNLKELAKVPVRYRNGPDHWATIRKKKSPKDKALEHFDDFYASVYGKMWSDVRDALLKEENRYMAVVNNFSDTERIQSDLELHGAVHLKAIYNSFKKYIDEGVHSTKRKNKIKKPHDVQKQVDAFISKTQSLEVQSVYPIDAQQPTTLESETHDELSEGETPLKPVQLKSIETELNEVDQDISRVINPGVNLSALYEYVPATKLKGLEDWIVDSDYYKHYGRGSDFSAQVEEETVLSFPEHLHIYTFEESNTRFPPPKNGSTGVLDYYLFDGASILPVLALDLQAGDVVLDMCAAPGGKALAILQTLMPRLMVVNDLTESRVKRINNVIQQYVSDVGSWESRLFVTEQDARCIEDKDVYNKILVDVPCTTDRHTLHSNENNFFKPTRMKERLQMPEKQTEILCNALKLVMVGGTVVYSTCTLSPLQNDGVVQMAMKKAWEDNNSVMVVKDMTQALEPLKHIYTFGNAKLKYGHIIVPTVKKNWGPMYFCKIVRVQ